MRQIHLPHLSDSLVRRVLVLVSEIMRLDVQRLDAHGQTLERLVARRPAHAAAAHREHLQQRQPLNGIDGCRSLHLRAEGAVPG